MRFGVLTRLAPLKSALWAAMFLCCVACTAAAKDVVVGFGNRLPPYVIPERNGGITVQIFREALAYRGHVMKPQFIPLKRMPTMFAMRLLDAAMLDFGIDVAHEGGFYGEPAIIYENALFTLADRHLRIERPEDMKGLSVLAFQGAQGLYPAWVEAAVSAGKYNENNNQMLQVLELLNGTYDAVLCDRKIFEFFRVQTEMKYGGTAGRIEEHDVLDKNPDNFRTVFRDENVRNDYEAGLEHLKKTGRYYEIVRQFGG